MDLIRESSASWPHRQQRKMKLALLLVSIAFSGAAFLTLDWLRTAAIQRRSRSAVMPTCRVPDPVRLGTAKPNCASIEHWGRDSYEFSTNSLGFRDESIREVPVADARPRILMLGSSFTEGMLAWRDSYVGRIAAHFPQYDFLNGGAAGYSPSNCLNTARMLFAKGVDVDEVFVFIGITEVQFEAAFYRDLDSSGAVISRPERGRKFFRYGRLHLFIARHFQLTNEMVEFFEESTQRFLVGQGYYHLPADYFGDDFDMEATAWTYRKVNETDPFPAGYAPLGVEGGIAKEKAKMNLLWQELQKRNIPISVVVYPYPAQLVHDSAESRQVHIWRDWCEGKCKQFISVFPAFFAVKAQCPWRQPGCWYQKLFIFGDYHYNVGGNALVADAVIKSLTKEPPVKRPGTNLAPESGPGSGAH